MITAHTGSNTALLHTFHHASVSTILVKSSAGSQQYIVPHLAVSLHQFVSDLSCRYISEVLPHCGNLSSIDSSRHSDISHTMVFHDTLCRHSLISVAWSTATACDFAFDELLFIDTWNSFASFQSCGQQYIVSKFGEVITSVRIGSVVSLHLWRASSLR